MNYSQDNNFTTLIRYILTHQPYPRTDLLWVIPITICYIIIFVCGVLGNLCTCYVIVRNKHMRTSTNYYLCSLAVSDLLLLISGIIPELFSMWYRFSYPFGKTTCVTTSLLLETSTNATILTITAFSVERYIAICHPFYSHIESKFSRTIKCIVGIWLLAFSLALPQVIQAGFTYLRDEYGNIIDEEFIVCGIKDQIMPMTFLISSFIFFVVPMSVIVILYILIAAHLRRSAQFLRDESQAQFNRTISVETSTNVTDCSVRGNQGIQIQRKSTKKVVNMLVAVLLAFLFCWVPFQVQRLYTAFTYERAKITDTAFTVKAVITYVSGVLFYLSAAINPVLYNIMSSKFREAFKITLVNCCERGKTSIVQENLAKGEETPGKLHHLLALARRSSRTNNIDNIGNSLNVQTLSGEHVPQNFRRSISNNQDQSSRKSSSPDQSGIFMFDEHVMIHQADIESHCLENKRNQDSSLDGIETIQECHLKILETNETEHKQYKFGRSCSLYINKNKTLTNNDSLSLKYTRKSSTEPCLTLH